MWISKRYDKTTKLLIRNCKQCNPRRIHLKSIKSAVTSTNSKLPTIWNLWLKLEPLSTGFNKYDNDKSVMGNLQKAFKGALDSLDRQEMLKNQQWKLETAYEMSEYVSGMMKDYFTSDNLWKVITKSKDNAVTSNDPNSSSKDAKDESQELPKFIQKRRKLKELNIYHSQSTIDAHTRQCVQRLKESLTMESLIYRLDQFNEHLHKFPLAADLANKMHAQEIIWKIFSEQETTQGLCIEILGRLGYQEQLQASQGVRILSIDGGGMKGVIALEILRKLEEKTGKKIHQLFDYCIGVSTGSIIIGLLALKKLSVDEATKIYHEIGAQVFQQTYIKAMTGMVMNQAYYDTLKYEAFLKEFAGDDIMASTIRDPECPRVAFVSAIMSSSRHSVTPFLFRNYAMPYLVTSNFRGSSRFKIWEACRASSAAPGFFDDFKTKGLVFQDGALIANNPSHIGLHETRRLWPSEKLQCLVSLGNGRYEPLLIDPYEEALETEKSSLTVKDKFSKLVLSCTDTEMTHYTLRDLLPGNRYFRFNPYLSEIIPMDETRPEKMSLMRNDSQMYCRRNVKRLDLVSKLTTEKPTYLQSSRRKLLKSMETCSNSLTAAAALNTTSAGRASLKGSAAELAPFHQIMTNILSNMKYK